LRSLLACNMPILQNKLGLLPLQQLFVSMHAAGNYKKKMAKHRAEYMLEIVSEGRYRPCLPNYAYLLHNFILSF
jgi:hypothetical protein